MIDLFTVAVLIGVSSDIAYHIGFHRDIKKGIVSTVIDDDKPASKQPVKYQAKHYRSDGIDQVMNSQFPKSLKERKSA